jgi:hypothetical protein
MIMVSENPPLPDSGPTEQPTWSDYRRVDSRPAARSRHLAPSVADGLMFLVGTLAAVLRFGELGRLLLSPAEATAVLASIDAAHPIVSPAYTTFTNLVIGPGGGDAAARLVSGVFGVLTVLLPWLWRSDARRGRPVVYLVAGLFMAVSPLLVVTSRTAGGDAIALFALLLLAVAGARLNDGRVWVMTAGMALGLGMTSSPLFYTGLLALLPAYFVAQAALLARQEERKPVGLRHNEKLRDAGVVAVITFVVVATGLLLRPEGLGAALGLFPAWLGQFGGPSLSPVIALLRYEPAIAILGLPAIIWALLAAGRRAWPLVVWLAVSLGLAVLQPDALANVVVALLPAYWLIGLLAASLAAPTDRNEKPTTLAVAGALIGLGALLLAVVGRLARLGLLSGQNATLIGLATLAFALAAMAVVLAMAWDNPAARRGAFVGLAALLLFWQWGTARQLSRLGANDPRERWVVAGTDDDTRVLTELLGRVSRQTVNSERDLSIFSQVDSPVLRWYLRGFPGYRAGAALPLDTQADVVITPADAEPALPNDYFGADFGLEQSEVPTQPTGMADALRWWLFRESTAPVETQRVVVWIRSDLATD